eukprot:scaffold237_cov421-Prasinococcus_capsulatus_cf.AAC.18
MRSVASDWQADADKKVALAPGELMEHDKDVGAVVVGFDRNFNYYKIQYSTLCIRENPGCLFIATNTDAVTHLTAAQEWAGNGSMVGCIKGSTKVEPTVVGKPSMFMLEYMCKEFGIERSQICMVGDRSVWLAACSYVARSRCASDESLHAAQIGHRHIVWKGWWLQDYFGSLRRNL